MIARFVLILLLTILFFCLRYFRYSLPFIGPILIRRYYNSGAYEKDVQKICENAKQYFANVSVKPNSLVIFDVDDTAVYNLRFRAKRPDLIKPKTVALVPVLNLYNYLISRGFKTVFLTSRDSFETTLEDLTAAGYKNYIGIICMTDFHDEYTAIWKWERRKELSKTYIIEGSIADRKRDFFDNYSGYAVKLPNYLY